MLASKLFLKRFSLTSKLNRTGIYINSHGNPADVLEYGEIQEVICKDEFVKLKLVGAPVNHSDINFIQGVYGIKSNNEFPQPIGFEGVFRVESISSKTSSLEIGDFAMVPFKFVGTWSEEITVSENEVYTFKTQSESDVNALISLRINPLTAYCLLEEIIKLKEGDTVIQNAANSHVGRIFIQLAKLKGIETINLIKDSVYSETVKNELYNLGAKYVYTEDEFMNSSKTLVSDLSIKPPIMGVNMVGGKVTSRMFNILKDNGNLVTIGGLSKNPIIVNISPFIFSNKKLTGFWVSRWAYKNRKRSIEYLNELMNLKQKNGLKLEPKNIKHVPLKDFHEIFKVKKPDQPSERIILV